MIKSARRIQNLLEESGYKTLAAGGFVRDFLLGKEPKDIDLATEALPEQVREVLVRNDIRVEDTGIKHGTVSAIINKIPFEITTLRIDKNCKGREAEVEFIKSFKEDAERRDFTVNAMFMNLNNNEITDYVGGQDDLKKQKLRFVGNPEDRIKEDYLRILRLFRFGSQLGFDIDPAASRSAIKYLPYMMTYISTERILSEMSKLIVGKGVFYILNEFRELIFSVFPEMYLTAGFEQRCTYHKWDVYMHTVYGVDYLKKFNDPALSFAHLFHDVAKPLCHTYKWGDTGYVDNFYDHDEHGAKVAQRICHRLKFSTEDTKRISFLIENHMRLHFAHSDKAIRKLIHHCSEFGDKGIIWDLVKILEADLSGQINKDIDLNSLNCKIQEGLEFFSKPKLECPITGFEIMDVLGIKNGPNVGKVKKHVIDQILEYGIDINDRDKILNIAKDYISKNQLT